jgi:Protein of unknown function (DUF3455)
MKNIKLRLVLGFLPLLFIFPSAKQSSAQSKVPESLKPPSTQVFLLKARAKGVQLYRCAASSNDSNRFEWTLEAPQATLVDDNGQTIIQHFAGPTWRATDGSSIVGQIKAKADSPNSGAIPWLLLSVKTHSGSGILSKVAN